MIDIVKAVREFTEAVGQTTTTFNTRQTALYIGLQLEEMAEKLETIFYDDHDFAVEMRRLSGMFKNGSIDAYVKRANRAEMLDADVDLAWVTIGSMLSQGADVDGAIGEVTRANMDKLQVCQECRGRRPVLYVKEGCDICNGSGRIAVKDTNGKVIKPEGWVAPNIEPFVNGASDGGPVWNGLDTVMMP